MSRRSSVLLAAIVLATVLAFGSVASARDATTLLQQKPFPPTDKSLFEKFVYGAPATPPAGPPPSDEATMRNQLRSLLNERFGSDTTRVDSALAIFDAESTKQVVPNARLRAALVSLKGTMGEPAINATLSGLYTKVYFDVPPNLNGISNNVDPPGPGRKIVVNERYRYEDFRLLASGMHHQPLHRDALQDGKEELITHSIDRLVYGQFLLESPELATSGTELSRRLNTKLMARLNSRDAEGDLRLLTSTGNVYPGGRPLAYFAAAEEPLGDDTPGNRFLRQTVSNVVGPDVPLPSVVDFDDDTVSLLDQNQNVLSPEQLVRLCEILQLDVYKPTITAYSPTGSIIDRSPSIAATVKDVETNLTASNIRLFVDAVEKPTFAYNASTDRLTYESARLAPGPHTVKVIATDAQGRKNSRTWSFTIE